MCQNNCKDGFRELTHFAHDANPDQGQRFETGCAVKIQSPLRKNLFPLGDYSLYIPGSVRKALRIAEDNQAIQKVMHKYPQLGMTVIDVGANIGYLSFLAARKVELQGKVFAVEPAKDNLVMLEKNVQLNQATNITVLACAARTASKDTGFIPAR